MTSFTPPVEIAAWLACAAFMVFLFNQLSRAWFTLRGKPTPIEQAKATNDISERVTTLETCIGKCKVEQDRRLDKLEVGQDELRELISEENGKIYNRVNAVADACATIAGEVKGIKENTVLLLKEFIRR